MQVRLSTRRLQMAAWCVGTAQRALDMMCAHARERVTFGQKLAERQTIQWWAADAATRIHAARLMTYDAAWKLVDQAMQAFGAMGMAKEMPLQLMANKVRLMRIYDGPSEVHRWVVARR